ncbi:MAG TPA: hypothetical protein VGD98_02075 [Ktedonobacteraceae bacterium]
MHSIRRKTPRLIAFGIAFLVLTLCFMTEAVNIVFASPLQASNSKAPAYTAGPASTAVTTYKQDNSHSGDQKNETILNTSNVNASKFGKKVSYPVDGQIYAQPLFVPDVTINGTNHNVVFVATEHDSVYAFDADQTSAVAPLWHTSYLTSSNIISATNTDVKCNDMIPENGLSGTPVIDTSTHTLYVVVQTEDITNGSPGKFTYKLHAIDITTGQDKPGSPITISATVSGTGVDSSGGKITFNAATERQRAGLLMSQGKVYVAFGSLCDINPYHGWIMSYAYDGSAFQQINVYNSTPNGTRGGLWAGGGAIVADSVGDIYAVTGNGSFNGTSNFGDSFIRLNSSLQVKDYFSPFNQSCLDGQDSDLGSGGPLLIPGQNRLLGAGKEGRVYVMDTTNLGGYTNPYTDAVDLCKNQQGHTNIDKVVEELPPTTIRGLYTSGAYWQNTNGQQFVYYAGSNDNMKAFAFSGGLLSPSISSEGPEVYSFTGGNPVVSSDNGAAGTGIVWALAPSGSGTSQVGVLRAYDALNLGNELYNSQMNSSRDSLGLTNYVKFSAPTVANGEVFVPAKGALSIYGLISGGSSSTPTGSPTPTGTPNPNGYNNIGVSYDNNPTAANYDNGGRSYSSSALTADGILQNGQVTGSGFMFRWPGVLPGVADNWVANGEVINVTPVSNADHIGLLGSASGGAGSGQATLTYTDSTTQSVTLAFNDWAAQNATTLVAGNSVVATMPYRNLKTGQQTIAMDLYIASIPLQAGKTLKSITLPAIVTGGQIHVFAITTSSLSAPIYNNVCIQEDGGLNPGGTSDNGNLSPSNCDNGGYAYSATALQKAGVVRGLQVAANNFIFTWPDVATNEADNYVANGQTISADPVNKADTLGFLGMATNGAASGTAVIQYTDGTSQSVTLGLTDWGAGTLSFGNSIALQMPYRDRPDGSKQTVTMSLFVATVPLNTSKTFASVTLPATVTGGRMHVFDISTRSVTAATYNNAGITDDNNMGPGNFDGGGRSYSANALNAKGVNPGDNAFDPTRTVTFTWPGATSGTPDNYVCSGQIIPVNNPLAHTSVLGFLGASNGGASSGTITVTYTDGTTTNFVLGFDDWTLGGGKIQTLSYPNESKSYEVNYRNTRVGSQNVSTYVFYNYVNIDPTKTIASVTLPTTTTGGTMHIFAVATAAAA